MSPTCHFDGVPSRYRHSQSAILKAIPFRSTELRGILPFFSRWSGLFELALFKIEVLSRMGFRSVVTHCTGSWFSTHQKTLGRVEILLLLCPLAIGFRGPYLDSALS